MRIAISGARGLVGTALSSFLTRGGHEVVPMVRAASAPAGRIAWDPVARTGTIDADALAGVDGVVHLAGENIADGRWTKERKARIRESRVAGTALVAGAMARLASPPRVLVCASAIGFYGDRGDEPLDEASAPGTGFLPEICQEWEAATRPAEARGVRVVHLRIGVVISSKGGALAKMLTPFRLGVGGPIGSGRQWMSWIALDDVVGAIDLALRDDALRGACNATSPNPLTSADFARELGRALHRPAILPTPAFALRALFGEMADAALLGGARDAARARAGQYRFAHPTLDGALRAALAGA